MQKEQTLKTLNMIIKKGKIDEPLREAVKAIIKAVQDDNVRLACDLSSVKSYISGTMKGDRPFKEDQTYNEKYLKHSVYYLLDGIHFKYAIKAHMTPSGMMIMSLNGITSGGQTDSSDHPIIKLINAEHERIWNEVRTK